MRRVPFIRIARLQHAKNFSPIVVGNIASMSCFNASHRDFSMSLPAQRIWRVLVVLLSVVFAHYAFAAANSESERVSGIIVKFDAAQVTKRPELADTARRAAALSRVASVTQAPSMQLRYVRQLASQAELYRFDAPVTLDQANDAAARIAASPGVSYAAVNRVMRNQAFPVDAEYPMQWGFRLNYSEQGANFEAAWDISKGSGTQTIGIVDSGVAKAHPELTGQLRRTSEFPNGGYDFFQFSSASPPDTRDDDPEQSVSSCGHGSHVAGTISAQTSFVNGGSAAGVVGGAPNSKVLMARALDFTGEESDVVDAMLWLAGLPVSGVALNPTPVSVINMSLGGNGQCGPAYADAISQLASRGVTVVAAAGNNSTNVSGFAPANCRGVVSVAASDVSGNLAWFSNFGRKVAITAPGLSIYSTGGSEGGNCYKSGTSMAAPHVTAALGLAQTVAPNLSTNQTLLAVRSSARPFPSQSNCTSLECGAGLLDAKRLLDRVASDSASTIGWNASDESVRENDGEVAFTLSRIGSTSAAASVNVLALNNTAVQGIDFGAPDPAVVSWAAGQSDDRVVRVPIIARPGEQGARGFGLTLSTSSPGVQLMSPTAVAVSIAEVDCNAVTDLALGDTVSGVLGSPSQAYCRGGVRGANFNTLRYRFTATAGTRVTLMMNSTTSAPAVLDPYVYLLDSNLRVIAENDDIVTGVSRNSFIEQFELPTSGTFYIDATTWSPSQDAAGSFQLSVFNCGPYRATSSCNLDIDNDGFFGVTDGLLGLRATLGFSSDALTDGLRFRACASRRDSAAILPFVAQQVNTAGPPLSTPFDFDGDNAVTAATDGLLLARLAAGMPLAQAVQGLISPAASRSMEAAIRAYLLNQCSLTLP